MQFDESFDVIVVGFGLAGGISAINAADAGAKTLLIEKSEVPGGLVHDAKCRVIDVYGKPIPHLYAAGELGSSFGHLYLSGGNIAECFVTGRIAGRDAAYHRLRPITSPKTTRVESSGSVQPILSTMLAHGG